MGQTLSSALQAGALASASCPGAGRAASNRAGQLSQDSVPCWGLPARATHSPSLPLRRDTPMAGFPMVPGQVSGSLGSLQAARLCSQSLWPSALPPLPPAWPDALLLAINANRMLSAAWMAASGQAGCTPGAAGASGHLALMPLCSKHRLLPGSALKTRKLASEQLGSPQQPPLLGSMAGSLLPMAARRAWWSQRPAGVESWLLLLTSEGSSFSSPAKWDNH